MQIKLIFIYMILHLASVSKKEAKRNLEMDYCERRKNAPILNNLFLNLTSADCCLAYFKLILSYLLLILD